MKPPRRPGDERHRLDALTSLGLLDTPPEADFDQIVRIGTAMFGAPIALVTLVDKDRQWFKARIGLEAAETPRAHSFCGHAILSDDVLVVSDARSDRRFHDNPLVIGQPNIRFYAGAPLRLPSGYRIGTYCVISPEPRADFDAEQQARLKDFAALVVNAIAIRALRMRLDESEATVARFRAVGLAVPTPVALLDRAGVIHDCNPAFALLCSKGRPHDKGLHQALSIRRADWMPPASGRRAGERVVTLKKSGTKLRVLRDAEGFVVVGA